MGRLPRLPLTILNAPESPVTRAWPRDHLAYCDLATYSQQRAYDIVREYHAHSSSRGSTQLSPLRRTARGSPLADGWVYNTADTIRHA